MFARVLRGSAVRLAVYFLVGVLMTLGGFKAAEIAPVLYDVAAEYVGVGSA